MLTGIANHHIRLDSREPTVYINIFTILYKFNYNKLFFILCFQEVLGCDSKGENQNVAMEHPDPFLRSMALWILKEHTGSLNTLLQTNVGSMHPLYHDDDKPEGSTGKNITL